MNCNQNTGCQRPNPPGPPPRPMPCQNPGQCQRPTPPGPPPCPMPNPPRPEVRPTPCQQNMGQYPQYGSCQQGPGPVIIGQNQMAGFENYPVGMGYVPWQMWETPYPMDRGFRRGTIFPSLDYPFVMGRCRR